MPLSPTPQLWDYYHAGLFTWVPGIRLRFSSSCDKWFVGRLSSPHTLHPFTVSCLFLEPPYLSLHPGTPSPEAASPQVTAMSQPLCPRMLLVRVSVAARRHHDHGNSYKGKHLIGVAYSSEVSTITVMVGSMAALGQAWC